MMRGYLVMIGLASALLITATMLPLDSEPHVAPPVQLAPELWQAYRERFIEQGRVVDHYQNGVSHSEGQGYGMLMAEAAGDRESFEQLWHWTHTVLQREDGLFSWRFEPCPQMDASCITDHNNASDGEILIAWALLRAHRRWHDESHYRHASRIVEAVANRLLVRHQGRLYILPGKTGFTDGKRLTLNLSYWIFPALEDFASEFDRPLWEKVIASGHWLLQEGRFGLHRLPPDWLDLENGSLRPSQKYPARYSFDAVRIPLHQAWSAKGISTAELASYQSFWTAATPPPAWIDLVDGSRADYAWNTGMQAIASLVRHRGQPHPAPVALPRPDKDDGYFSWSLTLLSHIAATESAR